MGETPVKFHGIGSFRKGLTYKILCVGGDRESVWVATHESFLHDMIEPIHKSFDTGKIVPLLNQ